MFAKSFEDVVVWQKAHAFVLNVYRLSESFPKHELFGLTSQLRRAAVSVPANFAEGFRKTGKADKLRFYNIAQGSLEECRYYLILINDLNYGNTNNLKVDAEEVSKMLTAYMKAISSSRQ
jgi:four helix bundle protein